MIEFAGAGGRAEELTLETGLVDLAARRWGGGTGEPVLAVHGWLDNAASFDGLAPLLRGLDLVSLDLPGHGLSAHRPAGVFYHFVDYVADVLAAADALGWERFALLGHSMGAGVASFVAAVAPLRVSRLVLIESLGPFSMSPERGPESHAVAVSQMRQVASRPAPVYDDLEDAARARQAAGDLSFQSALTLARRGVRAQGGRVVWRSDPRVKMKSPHYYSERQVLAYLRRIAAPTCVLHADQGLLASRDMSRRYAAVEQITTRGIPGGHHVHLDDPEVVAPLVTEAFA